MIQGVIRAPEQPRSLLPHAAVLSFENLPGLHGNEEVPEIDALTESPGQPLLPDAGRQDQDGVGAAGRSRTPLWLSACRRATGAAGPGPAAHHAEAAAVVEGDGGVEASSSVELHVRPEAVDAGGQ